MANKENLGYSTLVLVTLLVFHNCLYCDFTFDDHSAIVGNRHVHSNETDWISVFLVDYWGTPIQSEASHKSYRPFTSLTFRWNHIFSGLEPFGYHITNLVLHIAVTVICYRFFLNILNNDHWNSFLFALFFGIHPLKSEAVAGIVGRAELLSSFFFIVALFCYFDAAYSNFIFYTLLASLSKEQGFTVVGVCIALEVFKLILSWRSSNLTFFQIFSHPSTFRIVFLLFFTFLLIICRFILSGGSFPIFTKFDNPASFEAFPTRHLTYNYLFALNSQMMLFPLKLCADWTMNSIPLVQTIYDFRNVSTLLFYLVLISLSVRSFLELKPNPAITEQKLKRNSYSSTLNKPFALALSLTLIVVPFIPASNLFFPVGFVIAERVLYAPSIGYSLLLAIGFKNLKKFFHNSLANLLLNIGMIITLTALAMRTHHRNYDWKDDMSLFMSGLSVNPNNAKLYNNVGHVYERKHEFMNAMKYFQLAAKIDPEDLGSELNIARIMIEMNRTNDAETLLWSLKPKVKSSSIRRRIAPHYLNLWINLAGVISKDNSRLDEAEKLYHEVISIRKDFVDAYINLGEIYIRRNKISDAIDNYESALRMVQYRGTINPTLSDIYYNIGVAKSLELREIMDKNDFKNPKLIEKLMIDIAENFCKSIESNPNHKEALINLSILLQKPTFPQNKVRYYREIVLDDLLEYSGNSDNDAIQFNIAMTMLDLGGVELRTRAVYHLENAIQIKPNFRSALYNLALLYYDFKDFSKSLQYLNDLLRYYPEYTKATGLEADIYSKIGQLELAQKAYAKVLERDSNNYEALHNLLTIYTRMTDVQRRKCFDNPKLVNRLLDFRSTMAIS